MSDVPRPLLDAAKAEAQKLLSGDTSATGIITALVGWGVLSGVQGDAVTGLLGLIPGAVALVGAIISQAQAAYRVFENAEPKVTPVVAPRTDDGTPLVPAVPDSSTTAPLRREQF